MENRVALLTEQRQKLLLTPELRQAIALLELPCLEVSQWVDKALQDNPLLELAEAANERDAGLAEYLQARTGGWSSLSTAWEDRPEPQVTATPSLQEHLQLQLGTCRLPDPVRRAAIFLIGNLDGDGYLRTTLPEASLHLGVDASITAAALRAVQSLEPAGIAARSLAECLQLQWRSRPEDFPLVEVLLDGHLEDLAAGRLGDLARRLQVPLADVQQAMARIRSLEPRPARPFAQPGDVSYVVADLTLENTPEGLRVTVNDYPAPLLRFSSFYRSMLAAPPDPETQRFLQQKFHAALWVIQTLERRRATLKQIMESILEFQQPFFTQESDHLRPLNLRQVSARVGVHESTVCRAVANKYVRTPRGLFPLRFFFANGIPSVSGEPVTPERIKSEISRLVVTEDRQKPLSDQSLTDCLTRSGFCIRRRTVSKYREQLGILPSHLRHLSLPIG